MKTYQKFVKDVAYIGSTRLAIMLRGIILLPVLAKITGAASYGVWSQSLTTLYFLLPLAGLCLNEAAIRFLSGKEDIKEIRESFYSMLFMSLFAAIFIGSCLFIASDFLADTFFSDESASNMLKIISVVLVVWTLDMYFFAYFKAFREMKKYAIIFICTVLFETLIISSVIYFTNNIILGAGVFLFSRIGLFIILFTIIYSKIGFTFPKFKNMSLYLCFALPLIPANIFGWLLEIGDRYIIGFYMASFYVGVYSAAYIIGSSTILFFMPILFVLTPTLTKLWEENNIKEVEKHLKYAVKYNLMLSIPAFFGVTFLSKQLLEFIANPEFVADGWMIIPIIAFATIFVSTSGMYLWIFALVNKTKIIMFLSLISGTINIILNIILIPIYGLFGAALSTLFSFVMMGLLTIILVRKYIKIDIDTCFIIKSIYASIIMAIIILLIEPVTSISLVFTIIFCVFIYFSLIVLLKSFNETEKELIKSLLKNKVL